MKRKPAVSAVAAAAPTNAQAYFEALLAFETDPWDVYHDLQHGIAEFVLVDVRSPSAYAASHAVGAINIPHQTMTEKRMAAFSAETLFVVYCTGPGCNGADKAAARLSALGRPVKKMIGGFLTWVEVEKFPVEQV